MHLLALRISGFLGLKPDTVLKHWAIAKILRSKPTTTGTGQDAELSADDEVCRLIVDKFEELGGTEVSYADIARKAWEVGRGGLATKVGWAEFLVPCVRLGLNDSVGLVLLFSSLIMNQRGQTRCHCCLR